MYVDDIANLRVQNSSQKADFAEYMAAVESEVELMKPGTVVNFKGGVLTVKGFEDDVIIPRIITTEPLILGNDDGTEEVFFFFLNLKK